MEAIEWRLLNEDYLMEAVEWILVFMIMKMRDNRIMITVWLRDKVIWSVAEYDDSFFLRSKLEKVKYDGSQIIKITLWLRSMVQNR